MTPRKPVSPRLWLLPIFLPLIAAAAGNSLDAATPRPPVSYSQMIGYIKNGQSAQFKLGLAGRTRDEINLSGRSILMASAVTSGQADAVDALLDWGMDVNRSLALAQSETPLEITPLLLAISAKANPGLIQHLLARGANVNKASEGLLPLNLALSTRQFELATLLLDSGARASAVDNQAISPLMELATTVRDAEDDAALSILAKRLVAAGCDVNAQNKWGGTALIFAVMSGNPVMVRTLLELGAKPDILNGKGESPLAIAQRLQREDLAVLLEQFGARQ